MVGDKLTKAEIEIADLEKRLAESDTLNGRLLREVEEKIAIINKTTMMYNKLTQEYNEAYGELERLNYLKSFDTDGITAIITERNELRRRVGEMSKTIADYAKPPSRSWANRLLNWLGQG